MLWALQASRGGQLERAWFDALADSEDEADDMMYSENTRRSDAEMLAKMR